MKRRTVYMLGLLLVFASSELFAGTITGSVHASGLNAEQDVVVYIDKIPGKKFSPPQTPVQMDQVSMKFKPHVLPVLVGTTVDFLNNDEVLHNVFTPDKVADKFNLGLWGKGEKKSYTFKKQGAAVLLCNAHTEMEAYVVAVPTPYFASTFISLLMKSGRYTIENVPAGTYTLKVWSEKGWKTEDQEVVVPEDGEVQARFSLHK